MAFDAMEQRRIMGHFATGVTVITPPRDGELHGMTANAVTSLSLDPPLVLVAVDLRSQMLEFLQHGNCFAMNILEADQEAISGRFAAPGPKDFSDLEIKTAVTGAPILAAALAFVDCRLSEVLRGGDHDIFIGEIVAGAAREGQPLLYYKGKYAQLAE